MIKPRELDLNPVGCLLDRAQQAVSEPAGSFPGVLGMHPNPHQQRVSPLTMRKPRPRTTRFQTTKALRFLLLLGLLSSFPARAQSPKDSATGRASQPALLWSDPGNIAARDLFYGPGGREHQPKAPVTFAGEDSAGGTPKFDVVDAEGRKWRAKVGLEAQPEVVSARLLWAVGYVANENYFVPDLVVNGLPAHLQRGQNFVHDGGHLSNVRLQQHPPGKHKGKREGNWKWRHNPFAGTREFDGLRVMMALISNWDLTTTNTAIREDKQGEEMYEVSDVGASFGKNGRGFREATSKNNLHAYRTSKFISKVTPDYVDFNFPTLPPILYIFNLKMFVNLAGAHWIGRHIPRAHVEWIAGLLAQLTPKQIRDAFRAAGYSPEQVEGFASAVEQRIAALSKL